MGPVQRDNPRSQTLDRLVALLEQAAGEGATLVVFPELAFTTFFPRWLLSESELAPYFERGMPNPQVQKLFDRARELRIGFEIGYAEETEEGQRFNVSILVDPQGRRLGKYRKIHLPGHAELDPQRTHQHLEKRYFEPGDLGFPVWRTLGGIFGMCICNDRRWPETYRVMGLQGVEMVVLGYNTPSVNAQKADEGQEKRLFHNRLSVQAGAYQNSTWVVAIAKAGEEDGHHLFGGSLIVNPDGEIVVEAKSEGDELIVHACDLDATRFGKETIFNFAQHRRIEHYGLITGRTGAVAPQMDGEQPKDSASADRR